MTSRATSLPRRPERLALLAALLASAPVAAVGQASPEATTARTAAGTRADGLEGSTALRPATPDRKVAIVQASAPKTRIDINAPMAAPDWALAERTLLAMNAEGVRAFVAKYVDDRGWLKGPTHWGIADGPDDAVEPIRNWPLAHMLGGPDMIVDQWRRIYEGHLDQFSQAKIPEVAMANDGIYQREFSPSFDWEHIGEGISGYLFYGLSRPDDDSYRVRMQRFAEFYTGEDPEAQNYDPVHHIIKSLWNGSKGPTMRLPTVDEWDGPGVPGQSPLRRTRFAQVTSITGDHPLNLGATNMAMTAYMLTGDQKYRAWLLEYVNAWRDRTAQNGGNIPSNIGLDGTLGGETGGKWYGGVFGWSSVDTGQRNYVLRGPPEGFGNALMLTGDQGYTQVLRRQIDNLYAQKKVENGVTKIPIYYGDKGWYGYFDVNGKSPGLGNRRLVEADVYLWSMNPTDLAKLGHNPWIQYLQGADPGYPMKALQAAMEQIRNGAERIRNDDSTIGYPPDATRWEEMNAVSTTALINLTMGANDPGGSGHGPEMLHANLRYFDPALRRAGLPADVGALVTGISATSVTVILVNTNPVAPRTVTVQTGAYAEHQATTITVGGRTATVNAPNFDVRLAPGAGETLTIGIKRYAHQPTLRFPWEQ
ncbi:MAG: hypothetical protein JWN66_2971 [Sphingomonas bacterium]|uniref:hypothetical protein n=1 Tax=Sphingomonas bacterium TaxID=1895847 RepID=UPI00261EFC4F|nr:hypothetical protein [Sphingomonas bacterium]MDB5705855.1 hypothetical protein [Sphingomonas bacterium]